MTRVWLYQPWFFFGLVFCWTWFFWLVAASLGISVETTSGHVLLLLGLLGPTVGGISSAYFSQDQAYWHEYWLRIVDPTRPSKGWYLAILLFVPVLMALAVLLDLGLGNQNALAQSRQQIAAFIAAPWTLIPFAFGVLLRGPLPEELGWRGYALDQLQARWSAVISGVILGAIWALWHLPLFFMQGMLHHAHGMWSAWFWLFIVGVISPAVIYTWIFNNTRRSTLAAILFHFMSNLTYELAHPTARANFFTTLLWILAAIAVAALWRADALNQSDEAPKSHWRRG